MTTRPKYCGEACYRTANARQAREAWRRHREELNAIRRAAYAPKTDRRIEQAASGRRLYWALKSAKTALVDLLLLDAKRAREDARQLAAAE